MKQCGKLDISISNAGHEELITIVSQIKQTNIAELDKLLEEATAKGKGKVLKHMWERDVQNHLDYHKDQKTNSKCKLYHYVYIKFTYLHF